MNEAPYARESCRSLMLDTCTKSSGTNFDVLLFEEEKTGKE